MKDITLTEYINNELKPRLFDNIPSIFPYMEYKQINGKWCSNFHADGSEGTGYKVDRSVITQSFPNNVYDNTRRTSKDIISLYMEHNGLSVIDAVKQLCHIVGIPEPPDSLEDREKFKKSEERREALECSAERQRAALYSPCGADVLNYLHSRGWTDNEIKEAQLGYISKEEASIIGAQPGIGDYYTLSIPLRSGSRLYGFKVRTIRTDGKYDKYQYTKGTNKRDNLFNLIGIKQEDGQIVVVEGELDALHAQVRGIPGVVATSGGELTEELLNAAIQRGIKRITLLFDNDNRGKDFTKASIPIAWRKHINILVATFPDETLPDGTRIHDVDEYLSSHSADDLRALIDKASLSGLYLFHELVKKNIETYGEILTDAALTDLKNEVIRLMNSTPDAVERDRIAYAFSQATGGEAITKDAILALADEDRANKAALLKSRQTGEALNKANSLFNEGKVQEALTIMGEAATELRMLSEEDKYSYLLALSNENSLLQRMKERQGELPTSYAFKNSTGDVERLFIPSGAITFVVGQTSHRKSTLLQNIALQLAQGKEDGTILYFSFEEDKDSVILQFLNKYMDEELSRNNRRTLENFYRGDARYIRDNKLDVFKRKKDEFFSKIYNSGKLRVFYEDFDSTELIDAIRFINKQVKVKAVFVDYIQLLYKRGCKLQRTEELKAICQDLKDLSVDTQIPIIVAAQANREVTSPLEMHSQKIAEAADLERIAHKVIFVWDTAFVAQKSKDSKKELDELEERLRVKLGQPGKLIAKLTKYRGGEVNMEAVLSYNANTGVIYSNIQSGTDEQARSTRHEDRF